MPKNTEKIKDEIEKKLEYIGLDFNNIPEEFKYYEPLKFKAKKNYDEKTHKQYRFIPVKEIELLLSPTNRLDALEEKYSKASPIYYYLSQDKEENILKHTTFLSMLKKIKIEDIEKVEEEQKKLSKKIPFKIKYTGNYLWQIYYSEDTDRYFMIVPTEDMDYSAFFYVLKNKIKKGRSGKIFVPIINASYSNNYLKKSEIEDLENYLWLFTKDWPMIYEVYDKKDNLNIYIIGETEVYSKIKTQYRVNLSNKEEANKFYKLIKALFIIQTEIPHYYKFETNINQYGALELYYEGKKIDYDNLSGFIKEEYLDLDNLHQITDQAIEELKEKLNNIKKLSVDLENEYLLREKQISTFLECKKSFFGKVKYFFKYNKKTKNKDIREKINKIRANIDIPEKGLNEYENNQNIEKSKNKEKSHYTIEELIENANEYYLKETTMKELIMDINALKLKNKNMLKKIENATSYIEEIESHKKSIFEFWKYTNKDEFTALAEGETEEVNIKKKITKIFDYKEDIEELGIQMDKQQRRVLTLEELNSIFITTTEVLNILNKVKTNTVLPKDIENDLKVLKKEAKEDNSLLEQEEFDIFGGKSEDSTKVKFLANKKHREVPKDKYKILDITKNTKQLGYKLSLEQIIENIKNAIEKVKITENISIYLAVNDKTWQKDEINIFNLNPEQEIKNAIEKDGTKINLYKINLKRNSNAIVYTNIIFYENQNKTLPLGMDLSTNVLFDISNKNLKQENKRVFKIAKIPEEDEFSNVIIKTITLLEYTLTT